MKERASEWGAAATPLENISFAGGLQRDVQGAAATQTLFLLRTVVEERIKLLVKVRTEY